MSLPTYFPLRWESTGDQWWYASPIDWAAANGHYDLVRELLRLDGNHLIQLTSLRRIRRLETVWDDEEQFDDVARCRSEVARKLLSECEIKKGKNSLIGGGYGGWLLYTAASAGDMGFVQELLERDPLLVFGEGEYGVTDILYAAARSKNSEVFKVVLDFAASPRFTGGEEQSGEIPSAYRLEIMNRAIHAAARGGNLRLMKELLRDCSDDAMAYRDIRGATVLHGAAARGQVEVVRDVASWCPEMIEARDNGGNSALHVAGQRGHLAVVEALILASPASITATNKAAETFLHSVVCGFQSPGFRRVDRQISLMKQLLSNDLCKDIINAKNLAGRTALHVAITGNIHSDLVELLMRVGGVDVNTRDADGMTPLDILRQRPQCASSELLSRQLISAGGMLSSKDYSARRVIAGHIKRQSMGSSPGTSFRISDAQIFLHTGLEVSPFSASASASASDGHSPVRQHKESSSSSSKIGRLKRLLHWPKAKINKLQLADAPVPVPVPLRQRFLKGGNHNNKRARALSSVQPSPTAKKKQAMAIPPSHRSRSSSFSKLSFSSHSSLEDRHGSMGNNSKRPLQVFHPPAAADLQPYDLYERSLLSAA